MALAANDIVAFVTGLGTGSLLTAVVTHWLARRAKKADENHDALQRAFDDLLQTYAELNVEHSQAQVKHFALCEARLQLIASERVCNAIAQLKNAAPHSEERGHAEAELTKAMRENLGRA